MNEDVNEKMKLIKHVRVNKFREKLPFMRSKNHDSKPPRFDTKSNLLCERILIRHMEDRLVGQNQREVSAMS